MHRKGSINGSINHNHTLINDINGTFTAPKITSTPLVGPNHASRFSLHNGTRRFYSLSPLESDTYNFQNHHPTEPSKLNQEHAAAIVDSNSPGYATRIVQYSGRCAEPTLHSTHQTRYNKPGAFPIVHLHKKGAPIIKPKPCRVTVRIGHNGLPSCHNAEQNRLLLEQIIPQKINSKQSSSHHINDSNGGTRSVLDALKQISHRRIPSADHERKDNGKQPNNFDTNPDNGFPIQVDKKRPFSYDQEHEIHESEQKKRARKGLAESLSNGVQDELEQQRGVGDSKMHCSKAKIDLVGRPPTDSPIRDILRLPQELIASYSSSIGKNQIELLTAKLCSAKRPTTVTKAQKRSLAADDDPNSENKAKILRSDKAGSSNAMPKTVDAAIQTEDHLTSNQKYVNKGTTTVINGITMPRTSHSTDINAVMSSAVFDDTLLINRRTTRLSTVCDKFLNPTVQHKTVPIETARLAEPSSCNGVKTGNVVSPIVTSTANAQKSTFDTPKEPSTEVKDALETKPHTDSKNSPITSSASSLKVPEANNKVDFNATSSTATNSTLSETLSGNSFLESKQEKSPLASTTTATSEFSSLMTTTSSSIVPPLAPSSSTYNASAFLSSIKTPQTVPSPKQSVAVEDKQPMSSLFTIPSSTTTHTSSTLTPSLSGFGTSNFTSMTSNATTVTTAATTAPLFAFNFGTTSSTTTTTASTSTTTIPSFSFTNMQSSAASTPPKIQNKDSPLFSFGLTPTATTSAISTTNSNPVTSFQFGSTINHNNTTTNMKSITTTAPPLFSFTKNTDAMSTTPTTTPTFQFGLPATTTISTTTSTMPTPSFAFGVTNTSKPIGTPNPFGSENMTFGTSASSFASPNVVSSGSTGSNSFSTTTTAPATTTSAVFTFGVSPGGLGSSSSNTSLPFGTSAGFGTSNTPTTTTTASIFGSQSRPVFGGTNVVATQSLFGAATPVGTTSSSFTASSPAVTTFEMKSPTGTPLFGSATNNPFGGTSAFSTVPPNNQTASANSSFGSASFTFGAPASSTTTAVPNNNIASPTAFGLTKPPLFGSTSTGFSFGASNQQPTFGSSATTSTAKPLGAIGGSTNPSATPTFGGVFGAPSTAQPSTLNSSFSFGATSGHTADTTFGANPAAPNFGSTASNNSFGLTSGVMNTSNTATAAAASSPFGAQKPSSFDTSTFGKAQSFGGQTSTDSTFGAAPTAFSFNTNNTKVPGVFSFGANAPAAPPSVNTAFNFGNPNVGGSTANFGGGSAMPAMNTPAFGMAPSGTQPIGNVFSVGTGGNSSSGSARARQQLRAKRRT